MGKRTVPAGPVNGKRPGAGRVESGWRPPTKGFTDPIGPDGLVQGSRATCGHEGRGQRIRRLYAARAAEAKSTTREGVCRAGGRRADNSGRIQTAAKVQAVQVCPIPQRPGKVRQKAEKDAAVATLDFETEKFKWRRIPQAFLAVWATAEGVETFWHENERKVVGWALEKVKAFKGIVFAHNGGKFDVAGYLIKMARRGLYGRPVNYIGSRIVSVEIGQADMRDSYAILPAPLRAYDKGTINYNWHEKGTRDKYRAKIETYAKRDATSLRALCVRFIAEHGSKVKTAAGAAWQAIKHSGVKVDPLSDFQDTIFREYYYGGMVQALRPGSHKGRFRVYDIKSAYPNAMLQKHGLGNVFKFIADPTEVRPTDFVTVDGVAGGCFPFRTKTGLSWPASRRLFKITGHEYQAAAQAGVLGEHQVVCVLRPKRLGDFTAYVTRFYAEKERAERAGDQAGRLIAKILVCSGYGKLSQRRDGWREHIIVPSNKVMPLGRAGGKNPWTVKGGAIEEYIDEKNRYAVWSRPSSKPAGRYNVATGASITGAVRARLLAVLAKVQAFYCDTDSVILGDGETLATGDGLGEWALELEGDRLIIAGKKLYGIRILPKYVKSESYAAEKGWHYYEGRYWKIASKGGRVTPFQLHRIAAGKTFKYRQIAPCFSPFAHSVWVERKIRATA